MNTDCMCCLATKEGKIPLIFKYRRIVLPWEQNGAFEAKNLICVRVFVYVVLLKHY